MDFSNLSDYEIITNLIKSKFHSWLGENRTEGQKLPDFYGYHDSKKLDPSDYTYLSFENFKEKLISKVKEWHANEPELLEKIKHFISCEMNPKFSYYFLDLNENDKKAEWHVYSTFAGFIS